MAVMAPIWHTYSACSCVPWEMMLQSDHAASSCTLGFSVVELHISISFVTMGDCSTEKGGREGG